MKSIRCSCNCDEDGCQHTLEISEGGNLYFFNAGFPKAFFDLDNQGLLSLYEELQRLVVDRGLLQTETEASPMALAKALNRGRFYVGEEV